MIDVLGWMLNEKCIDEDIIVDLKNVAAVTWRVGIVPLNGGLSIDQLTGVLENQGLRFEEGRCKGSFAMNGGGSHFNDCFG